MRQGFKRCSLEFRQQVLLKYLKMNRQAFLRSAKTLVFFHAIIMEDAKVPEIVGIKYITHLQNQGYSQILILNAFS